MSFFLFGGDLLGPEPVHIWHVEPKKPRKPLVLIVLQAESSISQFFLAKNEEKRRENETEQEKKEARGQGQNMKNRPKKYMTTKHRKEGDSRIRRKVW